MKKKKPRTRKPRASKPRTPKPVLYILESNRPSEILEGLSEGKALKTALHLAGMDSTYFMVVNREMLANALTRIGDEIRQRQAAKPELFFVPIVHIAAHGNTEAIGLTSGEQVTWEQLGDFLYDLKDRIGIHRDLRSHMFLSMSGCLGIYGCQVARKNHPAPFNLVFGPQVTVDWSDALTAWIAFYHLYLTKRTSLQDAISGMNVAAGLPPQTFAVISGEHFEDFLRRQ